MSQAPTDTNADQAAKDRAKHYKKSLNLPKTDFPMKANLVQNEPASQKRWDKADLYNHILADDARTDTFVFHDGPPYANASLHLGHMLNKSLKDFVLRSKLMQGHRTPFVPGWDCHGLPIEHKVLTELKDAGKLDKLAALPEDDRRMAIRRECKAYASKAVKRHTKQLKRLLTLADYDNPYLTMIPAYEGAVLEVFAALVSQGLVYRQLKAVHWSIANETALAEAELEYRDREDLSVYVDFEARDASAVYDAFDLQGEDRPTQTPCFMIWTTTPWTLPANLAIAVNEKFTYALVKLNGGISILAQELVDKVAALEGIESPQVIATTTGARLANLRYTHPFVDPAPNFDHQPDAAMRGADPTGIYRVITADYVTLDDGTGLVHTAPGHGSDDYLTGLREKLPIYCPVRADGTYDQSVPTKFQSRSVWDANQTITDDLRASGHLYHDHTFDHSYPHDWRSKTPVIFRATEQWFVGVEEPTKRDAKTLRDLAFNATDPANPESVKFIPEWGRNRMRGMLESRPDWCISRQRAWGLPIPAFYDKDDNVLLTTASVTAVAKAFREEGSDAWFTKDPAHLLRFYDPSTDPDLDGTRKSLDLASLRKGYDIFDVWFESGSSWNAVMRERFGDDAYPIDLYLEGSDQHRGWFQLSLLPALGMTGQSPYKSVLTHGFMVDKNGHKMSKSIGNTLDVDQLLEDFGADVCRWWLASISYEADIKADVSFFQTAGEAYRKVRNTLRFMLSNLSDFQVSQPDQPGHCVALASIPPTSLEAWILTELSQLIESVTAAYNAYEFQRASTLLYNFCNDRLSATYLMAIKDRLYCDTPDSPRRRRAQTVLWDITDALCKLLAPILVHTADEAFNTLNNTDPKDPANSVHTARFPSAFNVNAHDAWPHLMQLRDQALKAIEVARENGLPGSEGRGGLDNPLDCGVLLPDPNNQLADFDNEDLADLLGISRVEVTQSGELSVIDLRDQPLCERSRKRHATVKQRSDGGLLCDRDAQAVGLP